MFYGLIPKRKDSLINFLFILFQLRVVSQDVKFSPSDLDELYDLFKVVCHFPCFSNMYFNGELYDGCETVLTN